MSCPNNEATKLNTKKEESCKENCSFNFSYNLNSSCILTNKGEYLDIKTDGKNKVTFNNQEITLQSTRLYSPSLHTFNNKHTDAELILKHSGANGKNILVSVPIIAKKATGQSIDFFSQLAKFIPLTKGERQNVHVNNWSLDNAMPGGGSKNSGAPFYNYVGSSPYPPCNMKATIIIFDVDYASAIKPSDLSLIKKSISSASKNKKSKKEGFIGSAVVENMVTYNEAGANSSNKEEGGEEALECVEFYDTGNMESSNTKESSLGDSKSIWSKFYESPAFIFVIFIIICFIGWFVIKFVIPKVFKKFEGDTPSASNINIEIPGGEGKIN